MAKIHDDKAFNINPAFVLKHKPIKPLHTYIEGIGNGDRFILSEALTLIESEESAKKEMAAELVDHFQNNKTAKDTLRLAITGAPGVGKSTFIEYFGKYLADKEKKVAVLAIDPSSQVNKGSILGDKTRMNLLSTHVNAYIRPSSAGSMLGGVAKGTKESILLCEAAGYNVIFVETVGVGQSEFWASMMVDMTVLLMQPGAGDEIQGIKRGIMEMADLILVNKADGDQKNTALQTAKAYQSVLSLFKPRFSNTVAEVFTISSINGTGFDQVWQKIDHFKQALIAENHYRTNRIEQEKFWFDAMLKEEILALLMKNTAVANQIKTLKTAIEKGQLSSSAAFHQLQKSIAIALNI
jgi:LAO/AO transport system kinase